ncbi:hypothetical protein [Caldimonas sp. KR1-144]|uniref:hypothetical protein n=1 Tax=Caldimonas sp. KR1-144 TaxID=3400911 RepID=UPI003BFBFD59
MTARFLRLALAPIVLAALAACGGGGGGSDDSTPAATGDMAAANYATTTGGVVDSVMTGLDFAGTIAGALPQGGGSGATAAAAQRGTFTLPQGRLERALVGRLMQRSVGPSALATSTSSIACSGGGQLVFTDTFASDTAVTKGDRVDVTSQGCIEGGLPVTGSLALVVSQYSESQTALSAAISLTATAFGSSDLRINGGATISVSANSASVSLAIAYQSMTATTPEATLTWDHSFTYTFTDTHETLSFGGIAHHAGASYTLRQDVPFDVTGTGVPASGQLSIIDKDGDRVQVTADGAGFTYTFYVAGSNTPTAGPVQGIRFSSGL